MFEKPKPREDVKSKYEAISEEISQNFGKTIEAKNNLRNLLFADSQGSAFDRETISQSINQMYDLDEAERKQTDILLKGFDILVREYNLKDDAKRLLAQMLRL
jgi:hypothetical protein